MQWVHISSMFICCSAWDHAPPIDVFWQKPPNLSFMHLAVSNVWPGGTLLTSHLTVLGLISTNLVPPGTSCTVVQEELLMLLMKMLPKAFLGLLLTPALTIYPDTFWKSTAPSPEAETSSSPPSLLSPRIRFSVLGEEMISLGLWQNLDSVTGRSQYPCFKIVSSKAFPSIRKSSRYTIILINNLRRMEAGTFIYFLNKPWGRTRSKTQTKVFVQGTLPLETHIFPWLFVQWNTKTGVFVVQLA